jgi:hypothetical protein
LALADLRNVLLVLCRSIFSLSMYLFFRSHQGQGNMNKIGEGCKTFFAATGRPYLGMHTPIDIICCKRST